MKIIIIINEIKGKPNNVSPDSGPKIIETSSVAFGFVCCMLYAAK